MSLQTHADGPSSFGTRVAQAPADDIVPSTGERKRRALTPRGRRVLFTAAGVAGMVASVLGFVLTSEAFDDRSDVLVTARDIVAGDLISAADLTSDRAEMGGVPHIAWTSDAPFGFDGLVAAQDIPTGTAILHEMVIAPAAEPVGSELELFVPLDTSLESTELSIGDTVLLIDPGTEPTLEANGEPRTVIRTMELRDFDGSTIRLLLPPVEWGEWRALLRALGTSPLVRKVPLGGDATEFGDALEKVWTNEWRTAVTRLEASRPPPEPVPGPGELEARLPIDTSLAVAGVRNGDRVLLIDPGIEPDTFDDGRPRTVVLEMTLENYVDGVMRLLVTPEDWVAWQALPERLGSAPMVLPIPDGTDVAEMRERLEGAWRVQWNAKRERIDSEIESFDGTFGPADAADPDVEDENAG